MKHSIFEVNAYNKFQDRKMTISVYGVRTSTCPLYETEFLVYDNEEWVWMNAKYYTPIDNKHS